MPRKTTQARTRRKGPATSRKRPIAQYEHRGNTRKNNPPVGLVTVSTDKEESSKPYSYDPHLDPQLQWAGKKERNSFEVPTVSLHVHERLDPRTIIEAVRKRNGNGRESQLTFFESLDENPPLREAIDFYKHELGWSNRLIAGDSLLVINSLLEKEGMAGKVQMAYFDPPYGIDYGSNFQPFVNKREVRDKSDEDLTQEPETIKAFRDVWEKDIHSYLTYVRDRLLLTWEMLHESGSCFVQISDQNLHFVRIVLDEVFGRENFCAIIPFRKKTMPLGSQTIEQMHDYLLWYCKKRTDHAGRQIAKIHPLFVPYSVEGLQDWVWVEESDGTRRRLTPEEHMDHKQLKPGSRVYRLKNPEPLGDTDEYKYKYELDGRVYSPPKKGWGLAKEKMDILRDAKRLQPKGNLINFILYHDTGVTRLTAPWNDTVGPQNKRFVVQTSELVIQRCMLMTTDPGDLVMDPTCGSGTTAYVAEQWGRRWITCDTSRVAITLTKQRLMTAVFHYYELARTEEGISSGLRYKSISHETLKAIVNREPATQYDLFDQPHIDTSKVRIAGPLTVEAVPAPVVSPLRDDSTGCGVADASISRSGPTLNQREWRDELLKTGIRGKGGQVISFSRVEPFGGTRCLHASAETKTDRPERVVISFGPKHAPLEQRQVEMAWEEARTLNPKPTMIVFAAFEFDPEAAKDIDELRQDKTGMTFLKAKMNGDLLTEDLKKKRASNESFWLIGQPDIDLKRMKDDEQKGRWQVEVRGFDYYNTKTGTIESGDTSKIAMWMLDIDYDGRSLYPRQVFFPMAGPDDGWAKLAKNLRAEIDEELVERYRGTRSLPFEAGSHNRIAVKIIDDRGIESLRILELS